MFLKIIKNYYKLTKIKSYKFFKLFRLNKIQFYKFSEFCFVMRVYYADKYGIS